MVVKKYRVNEFRKMYLEFFQSKGHLIMKSFSLMPYNNSNLLLINSGMAPLEPHLTGQETPLCHRVTTCQKCIRTDDIDNVDKTARYGTFFEVLGNSSFGDYSKREAVHWSWEFLTKTVGLKLDRLYLLVYEEDDEVFAIWQDEIGIAPERTYRLGKTDNFWEHGSGPYGPCSETYYDRGETYGTGPEDVIDGESGCFVEAWDNVFSQFNNDGHGHYTELKQKNIDVSMSPEHLAVVVQDVESIFKADTICVLLDEAAELTGAQYKEDEKKDVSLHVITDHMRSYAFMISDGIIPSNEDRGYVLRKLLRRVARHGKSLGIEGAFLNKLAKTMIAFSEDGYPGLEEKRRMALKMLTEEEMKSNRMIDQSFSALTEPEETLSTERKAEFSGEDAFRFYDTYGFPLGLTREILAERDFIVDGAGLQRVIQVQRETAWKVRKTTNYMGRAQIAYQQTGPAFTTEFAGYDKLTDEGEITAMVRILPGESEKDATALTGALVEDDEGTIATDKMSLYATMGGQQGDTGVIEADNNRFTACDMTHLGGGKVGHTGRVLFGVLRVGRTVTLTVSATNREDTAESHSGTHLLHEALREVFGDHVNQAGSLMSADKLRLDLTHFAAFTPEEIGQAETLVNREIRATHPVEIKVASIEETKEEGAKALFGERYGDGVRVMRMGGFSTELCSGAHVKNTENIGAMKTISETGISVSVRRIGALTDDTLTAYYEAAVQGLEALAAQLKTSRTELSQHVRQLQQELRENEEQNEKLRTELAWNAAANAGEKVQDVRGVKLLTTALTRIEMNELRDLDDSLPKKTESSVAVLASADEAQVNLFVMVGKMTEEKSANVGKLIKVIASLIGGDGDGGSNIAQTGDKNPAGMQVALAKAARTLAGELH